jgi:hypothetical protein
MERIEQMERITSVPSVDPISATGELLQTGLLAAD